MQIVVLTNESLKDELTSNRTSVADEIIWIENFSRLQNHQDADVFIDLLFDNTHIGLLQSFLPKLVIINSVENTLSETDRSFVRINGWPTFLRSQTVEASFLMNDKKQKAEEVFSVFNKRLEWLPDKPGFVTPRVVSMIINEAFICLKEGVSTKEEIDTAMKLGTNYPYGPFEWYEKIGPQQIKNILHKLGQTGS